MVPSAGFFLSEGPGQGGEVEAVAEVELHRENIRLLPLKKDILLNSSDI